MRAESVREEWEWECDNCHQTDVPSAPMLFDDVWQKLAEVKNSNGTIATRF
jgi:hypothetical protein